MDKQIVSRRLNVIGAALAGVAGFVSTVAHAALPTEATAAITALQTDGTSLVSLGWPLLVAITGGLILMGVFKKVLSRAT